MSERPAGKRSIAIGLVAVCATLLTSACAAGQHAQSANVVPAIDATSGSIGTILLRNVAIKPPPDGPSYAANAPAQLQFVIVNVGRGPDTLTGVTSPAASGFQVFATQAEAQAAASPSAAPASPSDSSSASSSESGSASGSASSSESGSASGSASSSESSSASDSTSSSAAPSISASPPRARPSLAVPAGQRLSLSVLDTDPVLVLTLTKALFPGPSVPITFTFAGAGSVTLPVPVQITANTAPVGITIPPISSSSVAG